MQLSDDDQSTYPKLVEYVKFRMPEVLGVPLIVKNMKTFGSLPLEEFRAAMAWGRGPKIIIKILTNACGGLGEANGCFDSGNPTQIELDSDTLDNFIKDAYGKGCDLTKSGKKVFIVGTTLLHELCHWGNYKNGVNEATEAGIAFEVATYGRNTG